MAVARARRSLRSCANTSPLRKNITNKTGPISHHSHSFNNGENNVERGSYCKIQTSSIIVHSQQNSNNYAVQIKEKTKIFAAPNSFPNSNIFIRVENLVSFIRLVGFILNSQYSTNFSGTIISIISRSCN